VVSNVTRLHIVETEICRSGAPDDFENGQIEEDLAAVLHVSVNLT
jgi:hypothetical protein